MHQQRQSGEENENLRHCDLPVAIGNLPIALDRHSDIPSMRELMGDILAKDTQFRDFGVEHDFPGIGHRVLMLNARRMAGKDQHFRLILLAMEDITQLPAAPK